MLDDLESRLRRNKGAGMKQFCIIIFLGILFCANAVFAGETIRHYDQQHNAIGYTVIEDGRETHFDSSWNRTGYIKKQDGKETFYDKNWKRIRHKR
jgi:hypothetical protein